MFCHHNQSFVVLKNFVEHMTHHQHKFSQENRHSLANGILYLKGGDLKEELKSFNNAQIYPLSDYFKEDFFETKKVVYLPAS